MLACISKSPSIIQQLRTNNLPIIIQTPYCIPCWLVCTCMFTFGAMLWSSPHTRTESLPEFIAHHTIEKLCMPCRLVLPQGSAPSSAQPAPRRRPGGVQQALQTGAGECIVINTFCVLELPISTCTNSEYYRFIQYSSL